ncbi:hypothetical protein L596_027337 [Steinernema carpocapsae]|uniref:Glutathione transferase n=1 Tax=Steinernema carpocapsae TaxID=34508 RepID=A0A4U5M421_STECR|nr:hypothetical protein L596_027337 [Steinernema carpocapsae]
MSNGTSEASLVLFSLPGRGRSETLRLMLTMMRKKFEDRRVTINEWREYKKREDLDENAKLPVLRLKDNSHIIGAVEIGRHLAVSLHLFGSSSAQQEEIESIVAHVESLQPDLAPVLRATITKNDELRKECWNTYKEEILNPVLEKLTNKLDARTFFVGDKVSWADFAVAEMLSRYASCFDSFFLSSHPILREHMRNMERMPTLKSYIADRPRSAF